MLLASFFFQIENCWLFDSWCDKIIEEEFQANLSHVADFFRNKTGYLVELHVCERNLILQFNDEIEIPFRIPFALFSSIGWRVMSPLSRKQLSLFWSSSHDLANFVKP